jgi:YidC/Oxa1 family membrane protein insertase
MFVGLHLAMPSIDFYSHSFVSLLFLSVLCRVDGTPSLGWDDTLAFLILPVFLVVSQFVSMELMQPKTDDPAQQQSNVILKILPFMIGWFSLSVPAALSLYWVVNNIVTTATSVFVRNTMKIEPAKTSVSGSAAAAAMGAPAQSIFSPPREKPSGFADRPTLSSDDGVKPITAVDDKIADADSKPEKEASVSVQSEIKKKRRKLGKKKRA